MTTEVDALKRRIRTKQSLMNVERSNMAASKAKLNQLTDEISTINKSLEHLHCERDSLYSRGLNYGESLVLEMEENRGRYLAKVSSEISRIEASLEVHLTNHKNSKKQLFASMRKLEILEESITKLNKEANDLIEKTDEQYLTEALYSWRQTNGH